MSLFPLSPTMPFAAFAELPRSIPRNPRHRHAPPEFPGREHLVGVRFSEPGVFVRGPKQHGLIFPVLPETPWDNTASTSQNRKEAHTKFLKRFYESPLADRLEIKLSRFFVPFVAWH